MAAKAASLNLHLEPVLVSAPPRDRWRRLRDLLGGLVILAVWLSLWSWVAVGVLAPPSQPGAGGTDVAERLRA